MPPKKKTEAEALKIVTDLQSCQADVQSAKAARDKAAAEVEKAQEAYRVAANRLESATQYRDSLLAQQLM